MKNKIFGSIGPDCAGAATTGAFVVQSVELVSDEFDEHIVVGVVMSMVSLVLSSDKSGVVVS